MKKWSLTALLTLAILLIFSTAASAFDDLPQGSDRDKILSLQERGIVSGYGGSFMGQKSLSNAEAVHLIVKALDLNLNGFLFIKEPLASDSFDNVPNDAWYAKSFIIAALNGLELARDIDPAAGITREAFAHHLLTALLKKGDYAFTKMLVPVADEVDVDANYRHSLQLLLNAKIVELDRNGRFNPKDTITRRDAAVMVFNTLEFKNAYGTPVPGDGTADGGSVSVRVEQVNDDVNKVTLSWGEKPNAGYTLTITKIVFNPDLTASVYCKPHYPEPGKMYAEMIVTPIASTYLAKDYKPVLVLEQ